MGSRGVGVRRDREPFIARVTCVEVVSALARKEKSGDLSSEGVVVAVSAFRESFIVAYEILEITRQVTNRAMDLAEKFRLRGYDAIQLSTAISARKLQESEGGEIPIFVSSDLELNAAAMSEGFQVEDPNAHS